MNTSVCLVPFFGVFTYSIVLKAYNAIQSQTNWTVKISRSHSNSSEELEDDLDLESLPGKMGLLVDESEKDAKRQQPSTDSTHEPIHQNTADEKASSSVLSDGKNTNEVTSDNSITTLCNEQGFKTIIAVNHDLENPSSPKTSKTYLETEIDSYSAIDFTKQEPLKSRSSTPPPNPNLKPFTFTTPNPTLEAERNPSHVNHIYNEIVKSKARPKEPSINTEVKIKAKHLENILHLSTLSLARRSQESALDQSNALDRVNSLPNLFSNHNNHRSPDGSVSRTPTLSLAPTAVSDIQYAEIDHTKTSQLTTVRPADTTDYCEILPESPPYVNNLYTNTSRKSDEEESIYEDVTIPSENQSKIKQKKLKIGRKESSQTELTDYENIKSPISEINFSFGSYENTENISLPALKHPGIFEVPKIYQNTSEMAEKGVILEPPRQFSSFKPSSVNRKEKNRPQPLSLGASQNSCYENVPVDATADPKNRSPSSSYAASSSQYSGNSIASTATSSFQGIQVCYFPPSPPVEFYKQSHSVYVNSPAEEEPRPAEIQADPVTPRKPSKTTVKRASRSKIPKPPKQNPSYNQIQIPEEPAPPLPLVANLPPEDVSQKPVSEQAVKLPGQRPPSSKAMRWYERLGCIHTGSLQVSEPYGLPGERKKSKERRRSQFFVDSDDPNPQNPKDPQPSRPKSSSPESTYVNYQDIDSHVPGGASSIQI